MEFKIAFFDCDGVLTTEPIWPKLHRAVGLPDELDKKWYHEYYRGEISFDGWVKNISDFYRKKKLDIILFQKTLKQITVTDEAYEIFRYLKEKGIVTAIISSGIDYYVEKVAKKLKADYWRSNATFHFDRKGFFTHFDRLADDPTAKVIQVKEICSLLGVKPTETFFVGDSRNDLGAFKVTKHGVLYRGKKKEYKKKAWKVIDNLTVLKDIL